MKKSVFILLLSCIFTAQSQVQHIEGRLSVYPSGASPDNAYNGNLVITKPAASGQYINLIRQAQYPWSIGTVYNTNVFAIGRGQTNDEAFINPFFVIDPTGGKVGVGTTTPSYKLDVAGSARVSTQLIIEGYGPNVGGSLSIQNRFKTGAGQASSWMIYNMTGNYGNSLQFWAYDNTGCPTGLCNNRLTIMDDGRVGIGVSVFDGIPTGFKLAVAGKVIAEEIVVKLQSNWPDHVFSQDYNLRPLHEVKRFVKINKHLPDIPSAAEVEENGLSMGEMQIKLLQKIEELTLYIIELENRITYLETK